MERERKVWTEHKELLLAGERAKFDEEKSRLLKDLQHQCNAESERCQHLERKLYDAQMVCVTYSMYLIRHDVSLSLFSRSNRAKPN